jgi:hypothetical protein
VIVYRDLQSFSFQLDPCDATLIISRAFQEVIERNFLFPWPFLI